MTVADKIKDAVGLGNSHAAPTGRMLPPIASPLLVNRYHQDPNANNDLINSSNSYPDVRSSSPHGLSRLLRPSPHPFKQMPER
jgi:hypothetical protein